MLNKKITFIGGGNMAEGIIEGLLNKKVFDRQNINVFDVLVERMEYLKDRYEVQITNSVEIAINKADFILIAVRPQDIEKVAQNIKKFMTEEQVIISICAGIQIEKLANLLGEKQKFVRIMPNTMNEVEHGYSAICTSDNVSEVEKNAVNEIVKSLGEVLFINENLFNAFTAYSCAGPAYVLYFLAALIDAGVQSGFSRKDAAAIASENLLAAVKIVQKTGKHPYQITDTMTSPAGITIDGLQALSEKGFHGIVMASVKRAVERTNELGV